MGYCLNDTGRESRADTSMLLCLRPGLEGGYPIPLPSAQGLDFQELGLGDSGPSHCSHFREWGTGLLLTDLQSQSGLSAASAGNTGVCHHALYAWGRNAGFCTCLKKKALLKIR